MCAVHVKVRSGTFFRSSLNLCFVQADQETCSFTAPLLRAVLVLTTHVVQCGYA